MGTTYLYHGSPDCCTTVREGQLYLVACAETKAEGLWSPAEQGTFEAWQTEHTAAHEAKFKDELRRQRYAEVELQRTCPLGGGQVRWLSNSAHRRRDNAMGWKLLRRAQATKAAPAPIELNFAPIEPTTPTGPGSQRGRLDPSARESRMAAHRRAQVPVANSLLSHGEE
jgi:hypothetical protein